MIKKFIALVLRFFRILSPVEKNKFLLLTISNLFASFLELIFISYWYQFFTDSHQVIVNFYLWKSLLIPYQFTFKLKII